MISSKSVVLVLLFFTLFHKISHFYLHPKTFFNYNLLVRRNSSAQMKNHTKIQQSYLPNKIILKLKVSLRHIYETFIPLRIENMVIN